MNSKHSSIEDRSERTSVLAAADTCLLLIDDVASGPQSDSLRQAARQRNWLVVDVQFIDAKDGPWKGAAMPGAPNGCGIFAGEGARDFLVRCDAEGIYLSATLDHFLTANRVRSICLAGEGPGLLVDGLRSFAKAHGYDLRIGLPDETGVAPARGFEPQVRDFAARLSPDSAALLLIDFQNDFCAAEGATGRTGASMRMIDSAVRHARELLMSARARGVFVVHVCAEYGRNWRSPSSPYRFPVEGRREPAVWTASAADTATNCWFEEDETEVCRTGTWGAEFIDGLRPEPGEAIITKHRFGAFAGTG